MTNKNINLCFFLRNEYYFNVIYLKPSGENETVNDDELFRGIIKL